MILEHYLQLLRHYRRFAVCTTVLCTLAVGGLSLVLLYARPTYVGSSSVVMIPTEAELAFTQSFVMGSQFNPALVLTQSHIEYLNSRPVAEKALARIKAQVGEPAPKTGLAATFEEWADIAFDKLWRWWHVLNSGEHIPMTPEEESLSMLRKGIEVSRIEASYVLVIEVRYKTGPGAAVAANALADAYIDRAREDLAAAQKQIEAQVDLRIAATRSALDGLHEREFELRRELGILSLEEERTYLTNALETEAGKLVDVQVQLAEATAELELLRAEPATMPRPEVLARMDESVTLGEASVTSLEQNEVVRRRAIETIQASLDKLAEEEKPLLDLERQVAELTTDLNVLRAQRMQVELASTQALSQVRIIDPATPELYPEFPKVLLNTVLGLIGGLLLAVLGIVVLDTTSGTVKTEADARRIVGDRALPSLSRRRLKAGARGKQSKALIAFGRRLERRLFALGTFEGGPLRVTGYGDEAAVGAAARAIGTTLAPSGTAVFPIAPVSARLSLKDLATVGPGLVFAVPAGLLSEEELSRLAGSTVDAGLSAAGFLLLER